MRPLLLLLLLSSFSHAHRFPPVRRSYDTHTYYVLSIPPGASPQDWLTSFPSTVELVEQVGALEGEYLIRVPSSNVDHFEEHQVALRKRSTSGLLKDTRWKVTKQVIRKRSKRLPPPRLVEELEELEKKAPPSLSLSSQVARQFAIQDPLWDKQWHLVNDEIQGNMINVTGLWAAGITGKGVNVAIVDDGLDAYSGDLEQNFFAAGSWDYNDHNPLPLPRLSDDQHGTRCAGEVAAAKNDVCGVGIAFESGIAGIRILSGGISDADEASSLNYAYQENSIYSCSWGPPDSGYDMEGPSELILKAFLNGVTNGRGGLGSIFVFASGNGGSMDDQCNFDGYTNSIWSVTVGAIDRKEAHPFYSEPCSALMTVTYSSGGGDNIWTTDVGKDKCTGRHGGTSAAAPIGAGIFALVLQARPDLTWRDLQHLVVRTAIPINENDPDWERTAVGRLFNHKYGYGKLDAWRLVEAAKEWPGTEKQAWWVSTPDVVEEGTGNITVQGIVRSIDVTPEMMIKANLNAAKGLEHVQVMVNIVHQRRGNVEAVLESPNGIKSVLAKARRYDEDRDGFNDWTFMSVKHWDEVPIGKWTLTVLDKQNNGKVGHLVDWTLTLWGQAVDSSVQPAYTLPGDEGDNQIVLPPSPTYTGNSAELPIPTDAESLEDVDVPPTSDPFSKTKVFTKPTAHLPTDHASAEGETHSSFLHEVLTNLASPTGEVAQNLADPEQDVEDSVDSAPDLKTPSTKLLLVPLILVVLFGAGVAIYFYLRARRMRKNTVDGNGRGEYERMPMEEVETRELYDAFGEGREDESDDGEEGKPYVKQEYAKSFADDVGEGTSLVAPGGSNVGGRDMGKYRD